MTNPENTKAEAVIVDYGLGNLFSIRKACERAGITAAVTGSAAEIENARLLILPGVGAFGDAMDALKRLDLVQPILDYASSGRPLVGICLGFQLLMSESYEFGTQKGLDLIEGTVELLKPGATPDGRAYKVPNVGWNRVYQVRDGRLLEEPDANEWQGSYLQPMANGEFQYFVHSYYVKPVDDAVVLSMTRYGDMEYCSSIRRDNLFACQFHPERSGKAGRVIYDEIAAAIRS